MFFLVNKWPPIFLSSGTSLREILRLHPTMKLRYFRFESGIPPIIVVLNYLCSCSVGFWILRAPKSLQINKHFYVLLNLPRNALVAVEGFVFPNDQVVGIFIIFPHLTLYFRWNFQGLKMIIIRLKDHFLTAGIGFLSIVWFQLKDRVASTIFLLLILTTKLRWTD